MPAQDDLARSMAGAIRVPGRLMRIPGATDGGPILVQHGFEYLQARRDDQLLELGLRINEDIDQRQVPWRRGLPIGDGEGLCETASSWRLLTGRLAPRFRHRSYSTTSEEPPLHISTATGTSPPEADVCRPGAGERGHQGRPGPKTVTPSAKRQVIEVLVDAHQLPIRRACHIVRLSRAAYDRPPVSRSRRDAPVIAALMAIVADHGRWGFWKCGRPSAAAGLFVEPQAGPSRVLRATAQSATTHETSHPPSRAAPAGGSARVEPDVGARLHGSRALRPAPLSGPDDHRRGQARRFDHRRGTVDPGPARVTRVLEEIITRHGRPAAFRLDNGPELTAQAFVEWCDERRIALHYSQPGKPDQNAFIERFNRSSRTEVLDAYLFDSLAAVRALTRYLQPGAAHDSLGRVPPLTFLPRPNRPVQSPFAVST